VSFKWGAVRLETEVGIEGLDLDRLQPYVERIAPLELRAGVLDSKGTVVVDPQGDGPVAGFVDDPGFGIDNAIGSAAKELVGELVKSPFRLLGKLGGGSQRENSGRQ